MPRLTTTGGLGVALATAMAAAVVAGGSPAMAATKVAAAPATVQSASAKTATGTAAAAPHWVGAWESAQVQAGTTGLSSTGFDDQTVRDIIHTSVGGSAIRIRISNVFGTAPLVINDVHVALRQSGAATVPGTTRAVTFEGKQAVTIPAGEREFSDPVKLKVGSETDLAVSIYFKDPTGPTTWHPDALSTNYYSTSGDDSADASAAAYTHTDTSWYFLDGVDVANPAVKGAVVTFGPSTTDGDASTQDANERYPDDVGRRLLQLPKGQQLSVLNAGISGNELLSDNGTNGQSALHRFVRDAVEQTGVKAIIIWEGTNDILANPGLPLSDFTSAYQQLISIAHAHGIKVIGATLQPDEGTGSWTPEGNALREAVNNWILTSGAFDGTADFSTVLEDPANPAQLLPAFDSGDHLHPNDAGYQAIADSINLEELTSPRGTKVFSGIGSASPSSVTLGTSASATETVTVHSLSPTAYTLRWDVTVPPGSGVRVQPASGRVTVPANGTATVQLTVTAPTSEGSYPITFNLKDGTGESALQAEFTLATADPGDLAPFYNNIGISDDGAVDQANLDGGGYSYSEQQLTAAGLAPGATMTVGDLQFTWPDVPAGQPDNVQTDGQTVVPDVPAGASEIGFLGAGANSGTAGSQGNVTINYTDGTSAAASLGFGGYALGFGGPVLFGDTVAATLPYRNYEAGTSQDSKMYVFEATVPVDPAKTVASITLPTAVSHGQIHVFALSGPASSS